MTTRKAICLSIGIAAVLLGPAATADAQTAPAAPAPAFKTLEIPFSSHDGHPMLGKLTVPGAGGPFPVVVFVQTAEAATADTRIQGPKGPLDFFDIYRREFAAMNVAFFSYEGRGARLGADPPRYVQLDRAVYNTSTLDNKVRDAVTAVRLVQKQTGIDPSQIFLHSMSEGTLLCAETAASIPKEIKGLVLAAVLTDMKAAMKFMMTDGVFEQHRGHWDANRDGTITAEEFDADPRGIRKLMPPGIVLARFDRTGDGAYTVEDARMNGKTLVDAVDTQNMAVLNGWLKAVAMVDTPDGWLADHLKHQNTEAFLSQLDMPIGFFQGEADALTPVAEVRALEQRMKAAGKTKMEFHYFPGLGHDLAGLQYFMRGTPSDAFKAMFEFVRKQTSR
jgi:pimeloyl-ACP methyl ester carboxylesterase